MTIYYILSVTKWTCVGFVGLVFQYLGLTFCTVVLQVIKSNLFRQCSRYPVVYTSVVSDVAKHQGDAGVAISVEREDRKSFSLCSCLS